MIRPSKIQLQGTAGRTQEVLMQTFSRPKTAKPGAASAPQISSAKKREPVHVRFTGGALVRMQWRVRALVRRGEIDGDYRDRLRDFDRGASKPEASHREFDPAL